MIKKPRLTRRTTILDNQFLKVYADDLDYGGSKWATFYWADGGEGVAIVAMDEKKRICVLNEYRHAVGNYVYSLPAGAIEDETPLTAAKRELLEETGFRATSWKSLGTFYPSPGTYRQKAFLYLARGLTGALHIPEQEEELISAGKMMTVKEVQKLLDGPTPIDAWLLVPLYRTMALLSRE